MMVSKEEYIGAFTITAASFSLVPPSATFPGFDLNPANGLLFPWLSNVAPMFEKYQFEALEFILTPGNPSTAVGRYYMAVDYDWDDAVATTAVQMMQNHGSVMGSVWEPLTLRVDAAKLNSVIKQRYVADAVRYADSQRFVYAGFLMVGAVSPAATTFDLSVRYKLALINECLPNTSTLNTVGLATTVLAAGANTLRSLPMVTAMGKVLSGLNGTPTLGVYPTGSEAYSIPPSAIGTLLLQIRDNIVGTTPASYAADTILDGVVFDGNGTSLGYFSGLPATVGSMIQSGVDNAATWAAASGYNKRAISIDLRALRVLFATAAYIFPYLFSTAGQTLSNLNVQAKYKEL